MRAVHARLRTRFTEPWAAATVLPWLPGSRASCGGPSGVGGEMAAVIETQQLTKYYGAHRGIVEVDLAVHEGEAFGFLGPNGAGKTTMIRLLLDHIRPTGGRASIFGIETTSDPVAIHRRLGYLPGEFVLYDRLTGGETIDYFANLRGGVDTGYQARLIERLDLDTSRRFREYSKGNRQKVGLVVALQHRPDLLLLDEPTSGLDPLVQQAFFDVVREARDEGRTVFMSSHILSEVEKTCDRVAIIREGRLTRVDRVSALRDLAQHHVELHFVDEIPAAEFEALAGVSHVVSEDRALRMRVAGPLAPVVKLAAQYELVDFVSREPSLEEIFLAEYGPEVAVPETGDDG
jgi:ABC-2 type transport system ATP-binding protein